MGRLEGSWDRSQASDLGPWPTEIGHGHEEEILMDQVQISGMRLCYPYSADVQAGMESGVGSRPGSG